MKKMTRQEAWSKLYNKIIHLDKRGHIKRSSIDNILDIFFTDTPKMTEQDKKDIAEMPGEPECQHGEWGFRAGKWRYCLKCKNFINTEKLYSRKALEKLDNSTSIGCPHAVFCRVHENVRCDDCPKAERLRKLVPELPEEAKDIPIEYNHGGWLLKRQNQIIRYLKAREGR